MATNKKKFGAGGLNALNTAINRVSEAVERVEQQPAPTINEQPVETPVSPSPSLQPSSANANQEKPASKKTIGVNIILPMEVYIRLQNMRMEQGNIPLRSLCFDLVVKGLDEYERNR